jgi:transcription elongation GreA/GreB family factor
MSRAFVREAQSDLVELSDRPVSRNRNLVTEAGLEAIQAALTHFEAAYLAAIDNTDKHAAAVALREVRYWRSRRASAEVVLCSTDKSQVRFGMRVSLRRNDGLEQSFRIVGEDEADPSRGTISYYYVSPLAQALMTRRVGDAVQFAGREAFILDIQ